MLFFKSEKVEIEHEEQNSNCWRSHIISLPAFYSYQNISK